MIKLAIFDVDGTLVSKGDRILLPSTLKALKDLKIQGIKVAIASGRPPFAMEKRLVEEIDFDYFICSNGCCVFDHQFHSMSEDALTKEEVERLTREFQKTDNALMFQFEDKAYAYHGLKRITGMIQKFLGRLDLLVDDREHKRRHLKSLPYAAVAKIEDQDLAHFKACFPRFNFEAFTDGYYDIYPKGVNKATGIEHVCDKLGFTIKDTICFGDGLNDLEMIKKCGISVAMGDAVEAAKKAATYITDISKEDGIYNALKHYQLVKE